MPDAEGLKFHNYEAFIAVVDAGNLTRAATRLGRSLQSISRSLSALERQLGVVLVRRTTRTAQATDAGLVLYRRVSSALREIDVAEADLKDASGRLSGPLRIAASALFASKYLVPAIREFSDLHPDVTFDLRMSERFDEPVRAGVDLVVRIGALEPSNLKSRRLATVRRVVVGSPSYLAARGRPERPADLTRHACLLRTGSQDARTWSFRRSDGRHEEVTIHPRFQSNNTLVVNRAAVSGLGLALAHFWLVKEAVEAGELEVILEDYTVPPLPIHALWPESPLASVKRFVDLLAVRMKRDFF